MVIRAASVTPAVTAILRQLEGLGQTTPTLALNVDDRVILVPQRDIIALEVSGTEMTVHAVAQQYAVRGQLKRTMAKLNPGDFVQVSKQAAVNLNHLASLEVSFSGNMMARLTHDTRILVSRKYLPALKAQLGM